LLTLSAFSDGASRIRRLPNCPRVAAYAVTASGWHDMSTSCRNVASFRIRSTCSAAAPRRALAEPWLASKPRGVPVFNVPDKTAKMIRQDLRAAGIDYADESGAVIDFHSLRHSYISRIVASGASVKVCQELARHSTPTLTIGRYAHLRMYDLSKALDGLPGEDRQDEREAMEADGTYDVASPRHDPQQLPRQLARETLRSAAKPCGGDNRMTLVGDDRNPLPIATLREDVRSISTPVNNARPGNRTPNPLVKSQLLCQLS